jgi:hypothetical protein
MKYSLVALLLSTTMVAAQQSPTPPQPAPSPDQLINNQVNQDIAGQIGACMINATTLKAQLQLVIQQRNDLQAQLDSKKDWIAPPKKEEPKKDEPKKEEPKKEEAPKEPAK